MAPWSSSRARSTRSSARSRSKPAWRSARPPSPKTGASAFGIGINIGDIVLEDGDIFGDGVDVAARLEALAEPGGICIARNVYNQVKGKFAFGFEPMGEHKVKNIAEAITVYCVWPPSAGAATPRPKALASDRPSVAVLPFQNLSGDPKQERLIGGLTTDIITDLSRFRDLFVIARTFDRSLQGPTHGCV